MKIIKPNIKRDVDPDTFYDFFKERYGLMVLGGYLLLTRSALLKFINWSFIVILTILHFYGIAAAVISLVIVARDKSEMFQAFYAMGTTFLSIGMHAVRVKTGDGLHTASGMLRSGFYQYNEDFQDEYKEIKRHRMKRVKLFVTIVTAGMYCAAFNFTVVGPLSRLMDGVEVKDEELNPYLPLSFYFPFNTARPLGFSVAYALDTILIYVMYTSFACHEELYVTCTLQLSAEVEVLNYSFRNLERRAFIEWKRKLPHVVGKVSVQQLYDEPEFQKCLYYCLRENVLHHHAILRFRKAICPYLESSSAVGALFFSGLLASAIIIMLENSTPQFNLISDIGGFLPMCWLGQLLADESAETKDSVFDTPWADCNEKFKALVKVLMANTQNPIMVRVKVFNVYLCLETFADMLSVGYKLLNVMR